MYKLGVVPYNYFTIYDAYYLWGFKRMNKCFPTRMVLLRKERGLSQKEAAARLGVSQALLSHYEKGIRECGLDFVTRAAKLYHVTCDYLLGYSESRTGLTGVFYFR